MRPIINLPRLNPILFVEGDPVIDTGVHSAAMLSDLYYNRIREWEDRDNYYGKWQFEDNIRLFINASLSTGVTIQIINCTGQVFRTITPDFIYDVPGLQDDRTGTHLYAHYFRFRFDDTALPEGYYQLASFISYTEGGDTLQVPLISEPLHIAADQPDTLRIIATNPTNKGNVLFEQSNCKFTYRVEGIVGPYLPDFEYNSYKDQGGKVVELYGEDGRTMELQLAFIPDYLHDKISSALLLEYKEIEGTQYVLDTGAKWDDGVTANVPLRNPSIILREADPDAATTIYPSAPFEVFQVPYGTAYRVIEQVQIGDYARLVDLLDNPLGLTDPASLTTAITALNAMAADKDISGVFSIVDTGGYYSVIFTNSGNERYYYGFGVVLEDPVTLTITAIPNATFFSMIFTDGDVVVDWGDGTFRRFLPDLGGLRAVHQYVSTITTTSTFNIRIYGTYTDFLIDTPSQARYLTAIAGLFPALKTFGLVGSNLNTFDFNVLGQSVNTLTTVGLRQGTTTTLANFATIPFTKLKYLSFYKNKLSTSFVNLILNTAFSIAFANSLTNGAVITNQQNPTAPPNFTGNISKSQLLASPYYYLVNTD